MRKDVRRHRFWDNFNIYSIDGIGKYQIPDCVERPEIYVDRLVGFQQAINISQEKRERIGIHFWNQVPSRLWYNLIRYTKMVETFSAVISPVYPMDAEMPKALRIWNLYKSRYLCAYWQDMGMNAIPSIVWDAEEDYDMIFNGIPYESAVAVYPKNTDTWMRGYEEMKERINPEIIYFFGEIPKEITGDNIIMINGKGGQG